MKRLKILKIVALVIAIATAIYIATEVHAYTSSNSLIGGSAYGAYLYTGEVPDIWYTPEELGAVYVEDWRDVVDWEDGIPKVVHIVVPSGNEPFPLQEEQPIFKYEGRFYQVSPLWIAYPVPRNLPQRPVGAVLCGAGWFAIGILYLKWRGKDEEAKGT